MLDLTLYCSSRVRRWMQHQLQHRQYVQRLKQGAQHLEDIDRRVQHLKGEGLLRVEQLPVAQRQQGQARFQAEQHFLKQQLEEHAPQVLLLQEQYHSMVAGQICGKMGHLQHALLWLTEACTHSLDDDGEHGIHLVTD